MRKLSFLTAGRRFRRPDLQGYGQTPQTLQLPASPPSLAFMSCWMLRSLSVDAKVTF